MKTKPQAILTVILATALTASGQILFKKASANLTLSILGLLNNHFLLFGLMCYFGSATLIILALRNGELSVLYPFIALGFIWVNVASSIIFNEPLNIFKWCGVGAIILGVSLIGKGSTIAHEV